LEIAMHGIRIKLHRSHNQCVAFEATGRVLELDHLQDKEVKVPGRDDEHIINTCPQPYSMASGSKALQLIRSSRIAETDESESGVSVPTVLLCWRIRSWKRLTIAELAPYEGRVAAYR
jgi:hypothetical protein